MGAGEISDREKEQDGYDQHVQEHEQDQPDAQASAGGGGFPQIELFERRFRVHGEKHWRGRVMIRRWVLITNA
ncbi:MAG: hypothetical protein C4321_06595 [Chloroflexota bacterium]